MSANGAEDGIRTDTPWKPLLSACTHGPLMAPSPEVVHNHGRNRRGENRLGDSLPGKRLFPHADLEETCRLGGVKGDKGFGLGLFGVNGLDGSP